MISGDAGFKPLGELDCAGERLHGSDDFMDFPDADAFPFQDIQTVTHQFVVIGLIPGGAFQFLQTGLAGHRNPDFRQKNALQIKAH